MLNAVNLKIFNESSAIETAFVANTSLFQRAIDLPQKWHNVPESDRNSSNFSSMGRIQGRFRNIVVCLHDDLNGAQVWQAL